MKGNPKKFIVILSFKRSICFFIFFCFINTGVYFPQLCPLKDQKGKVQTIEYNPLQKNTKKIEKKNWSTKNRYIQAIVSKVQIGEFLSTFDTMSSSERGRTISFRVVHER
jgi:hypothetical protein